MEIIIRGAKPSDLKNLAVLLQQVWISTYATEGILEEFSSYVLSEYSLENVRNSIEDRNKRILMATINDCVVGCAVALLTPQSPASNVESGLEISTLYVLESFQGKGIGKKLLTECEREVKRLGFSRMWLTVYYGNEKAITFYTSQGFTRIGEMDFVLGEQKYKNYIMLKIIG